ncbi:hypothetical protein QL285_015237 [Trifolium repens]|nr:hypothetical protein QL285_015237 [Trifolium repens]
MDFIGNRYSLLLLSNLVYHFLPACVALLLRIGCSVIHWLWFCFGLFLPVSWVSKRRKLQRTSSSGWLSSCSPTMNQDEFSKSVEQVPMQDKMLLELTVDAVRRAGIFSSWENAKPIERGLKGWERIAEQFNQHFSPYSYSQHYMKAPSELCCRVVHLKKKAEKAKFKLEGSPLEQSLTYLFKTNKVTFPSFMTEGGDEVEMPRSRSPIRTTPGSSGCSSVRYKPYPSASFATPTDTTSYDSPTADAPPIDYLELQNILESSGIDVNSIPYIVKGITRDEFAGLKFSPEASRMSYILDLKKTYFKPCQPYPPYQPYQPHDFRGR